MADGDRRNLSEHYREAGNALALKLKHKEALVQYNAAIKMDATNTAAYAARGTSKHQLGNLPGSIADLGMAQALKKWEKTKIISDPHKSQLVSAINDQGQALLMAGKFKEAMIEFKQALVFDPNSAVANTQINNICMQQLLLGMKLAKSNDSKEAFVAFKNVLVVATDPFLKFAARAEIERLPANLRAGPQAVELPSIQSCIQAYEQVPERTASQQLLLAMAQYRHANSTYKPEDFQACADTCKAMLNKFSFDDYLKESLQKTAWLEMISDASVWLKVAGQLDLAQPSATAHGQLMKLLEEIKENNPELWLKVCLQTLLEEGSLISKIARADAKMTVAHEGSLLNYFAQQLPGQYDQLGAGEIHALKNSASLQASLAEAAKLPNPQGVHLGNLLNLKPVQVPVTPIDAVEQDNHSNTPSMGSSK